MNYQQNLVEHQLADASRYAANVIGTIISSPELAEAVAEGHHAHQETFVAFLLVPGATSVRPSELTDAFYAAHRTHAGTKTEAIEALLEQTGWTERLDHFSKDLGATDLLVWDELRLREALEERYEFVDADSKCYVFDREALRQYLRR